MITDTKWRVELELTAQDGEEPTWIPWTTYGRREDAEDYKARNEQWGAIVIVPVEG